MPEITSVETIRAKLREFEERVDGAITAAKTLARIKTDAETLLTDIKGISTKSEQSLQKAEGVRLQLQQLQREWDALKQQVDKALAESKETRDLVLSEVDSGIQSLGNKVAEAEERLKATNKTSLAEQADLLRRLDGSTRANAEVAVKAQATVTETAARLEELLATLRDELHAEVHSRLTKAEELLESELQRVEKYLEEEQAILSKTVESNAERHERLLREEMKAFKEDMQRNLAGHQQAIDRQLTDFLNKQNALVQNLSQQIDSFGRVAQTQSAELATTNTKVSEIALAFNAHKTTTAGGLAALTGGMTEIRALLTEVQAKLRSQDKSIAAIEQSLEDTAARLHQTLDRLKELPFFGGKFK